MTDASTFALNDLKQPRRPESYLQIREGDDGDCIDHSHITERLYWPTHGSLDEARSLVTRRHVIKCSGIAHTGEQYATDKINNS